MVGSNVGGMFESYAQNCEDVVLWRALRHVETGTYVDVGAADPDDDSVTKAFYERGWSGLHVEPAGEHADRLRARRVRDTIVQACAGEHDGTVVLHHVIGTGLSSVLDGAVERIEVGTREIVDEEVPMRRLDEILATEGFDGRDVHFLKVDVEGSELQVLLGIDLKVWRPWVVVVEATLPNSTEQAHHDWEPLLLDAGYTYCLFDGLNRYYASPDHQELIPALSYPACVFDQPFVTPPHAALLAEYNNLLDGNQRLRALYDDALVSYEESSAALTRTAADFERLEETYRTTVGDWQRLEAEYLRCLADKETLLEVNLEQAAALDTVRADVAALHATCDTLRDGVARMGAEFDDLRSQRDGALQELALIRQTLSWRVTKPLRFVRRLRAR